MNMKVRDKREATIEDLCKVPEDGKAEIIGGELVLMSPTQWGRILRASRLQQAWMSMRKESGTVTHSRTTWLSSWICLGLGSERLALTPRTIWARSGMRRASMLRVRRRSRLR